MTVADRTLFAVTALCVAFAARPVAPAAAAETAGSTVTPSSTVAVPAGVLETATKALYGDGPARAIGDAIRADFDADGVPDVAMLASDLCEGVEVGLEHDRCVADGRSLGIAMGRADGTFVRSVVVPVGSTVGVHGDGFDGMKLRGRTLSLSGGSSSCAGNVGGTTTLQYRFQDGDWYRIGDVQRRWVMTEECNHDRESTNDALCPELKPKATELCIERETSTNHNTATQEARITVTDLQKDGVERVVIRRTAIPRKPLVKLHDDRVDLH